MLYPPTCPICQEVLLRGIQDIPLICPACNNKITYIGDNHCLKCGKELNDPSKEYCYDCARIKHRYIQGTAAFAYTEGIKQSVYRFKYKDKREYAVFYADAIYRSRKDLINTWHADALIPVPLHSSKQRKRGYNQAELFARELSKRFEIDLCLDSLIRYRKTKPMKTLNDEQRHKNLKNAFMCADCIVKYNKVILVDDIYTTGATIDACADALIKKGISEVYFICLCVGRGF